MMKMEKKKNIIIKLIVFFVLLIGIATALIVKNREWFFETVPYHATSHGSDIRGEDEIVEEVFDQTGFLRYREGEFVEDGGAYWCVREGCYLDVTMNVTIKKGSFKVATYELGDDFVFGTGKLEEYLTEDKKVHEEEYTESGVYKIDLSMMKPDQNYIVLWMTPLGGDVAYSYDYTSQLFMKRWQLLYDDYIGSLPFFEPKYDTTLKSGE